MGGGASDGACMSSNTHADMLLLQVVQERQATTEKKVWRPSWDRLAQASACSMMVDAEKWLD